MTLGDYLAQCGRRPRTAGEHDCCTFPADWVALCGYADPMGKWRGTYATDLEGEYLIAAAGEATDGGGLEALFTEGMAEAGVPVASGPPEAGDVAVIAVGGEEAGAVFTGKRWAFVPARGLGFVSLDPENIRQMWRPRTGG